jgi:predicted transcriptional regulator of viral defense system
MSRLVNNRLTTRPINGNISFIKDNFLIASQLISPSYISMHSALLYHNIIDRFKIYRMQQYKKFH